MIKIMGTSDNDKTQVPEMGHIDVSPTYPLYIFIYVYTTTHLLKGS